MGRPRAGKNSIRLNCWKEFYIPPSRVVGRTFCCRQHQMQYMNKILNPERMTQETRQKIRDKHLNTGEGKTYTKLFSRHEHRVVAEQMLGRPLKPGEVVHHIDENKRNNNPKNLMVFSSQAEHAAFHAKAEESEVMPDGI